MRPRRAIGALVVAVLVAAGWAGASWVAARPNERAAAAGAAQTAAAPSGVAPARGVTWVDFAGLDLPVSGVHGPGCGTGGRAGCFTRDEAGAAVAAVHLLVRTFPFAGPDVFSPTIAEQVVGDERARLARLTVAAYRDQTAGDPHPPGGVIRSEGGSVAGYRVEPGPAPAGDVRVVRVLVTGPGEAGVAVFTEYRVEVVWQGGDWRLVAPAWGDWSRQARVVPDPDPAGYASYDALDAS